MTIVNDTDDETSDLEFGETEDYSAEYDLNANGQSAAHSKEAKAAITPSEFQRSNRWGRAVVRARFWFPLGALLFLGCFLIGWPLGTSLAEYNQTGIFHFRLGFTFYVFLYMITIPILIMVVGYILTLGFRMAEKAEELEFSAHKLLKPDANAERNVQSVGSAIKSHMDVLNGQLDDALGKLASVEKMIRQQVAVIDSTATSLQDKAAGSVNHVAEEREKLIQLTENLNQEADLFAEAIAEKAKLGLDESNAANARIAGAEVEMENRLQRLENAAERGLEVFSRLAEIISEKEAAVVQTNTGFAEAVTQAGEQATRITQQVEQNANELSRAHSRLEEESERLEALINDQRDRADKLADAIAQQTNKLSQLTLAETVAEPVARVAETPTPLASSPAPQTEQPAVKQALKFTSIEPHEPVKPKKTSLPKGLPSSTMPQVNLTQKQSRREKSWSDILAAADLTDAPLTLDNGAPLSASDTGQSPASSENNDHQEVIELIHEMQNFMLEVEEVIYGAPEEQLVIRFTDGERNLFANRLLNREEEAVKNRLRLATGRNIEFRKSVYDFLQRFDTLLEPATDEEDSDALIDDYLGSPLGRVYLVIGSAMDYFS